MKRIACFALFVILLGVCCNASAVTKGEENALSSANMYLSAMPLSYHGLIKQLEFDGYTADEAQYGADNCNADWNEQAVRSAEAYLNAMPMSRIRLQEQLQYDGFTASETDYAVAIVYDGKDLTSTVQPTKQEIQQEININMPEGFIPVVDIMRESITKADLEKHLTDLEYSNSFSKVITDTIVYENEKINPYELMIEYTGTDQKLSGNAIIYYQKDGSTFSYLVSYLTAKFGNPEPTPEEQKSGESYNWHSDNQSIQLSVVGTLKNAEAGNEEYYLVFRKTKGNTSVKVYK